VDDESIEVFAGDQVVDLIVPIGERAEAYEP
jgi:hypothetical protein